MLYLFGQRYRLERQPHHHPRALCAPLPKQLCANEVGPFLHAVQAMARAVFAAYAVVHPFMYLRQHLLRSQHRHRHFLTPGAKAAHQSGLCSADRNGSDCHASFLSIGLNMVAMLWCASESGQQGRWRLLAFDSGSGQTLGFGAWRSGVSLLA